MERTVPSTASEEIELYLRTYYSLLRSTSEVHIRTLEEAHARMKSLLHPKARDPSPDIQAFVYALLRLPGCMPQVGLIVLGQSPKVFLKGGYGDIEGWQQVSAVARRRRCFFDGADTMACFIASRTDIDDVIPLLTAYQIEWNKMHIALRHLPSSFSLEKLEDRLNARDHKALQDFADALDLSWDDLTRLRTVWGKNLIHYLKEIEDRPIDLKVKLLSGSLNEYWRATRLWWENIQTVCPELQDRPVYFVSSNTHSLANLITGYASKHRSSLVDFLEEPDNYELMQEWEQIQTHQVPSSEENFLYYIFKKYINTPSGQSIALTFPEHEESCGILRIPSEHTFDVEAQVITLSNLNLACMDKRVNDESSIVTSDALILNIDYPLGLSAYNILSKVAEHVGEILGVYIIGKAATLNGVIGDIMIPSVVHDEQSQNTYIYSNSFTADDVSDYLVYGTVLDNQKAVTVRGTFLQNDHYMDVFYREGYTDIEMEAGPYLSAVYEMYRPQRHPANEIVNLYGLPFDLGIIHYASDTPFAKGRNLGVGSLSYYGMDSTYAASIAILRRIFYLERKRLEG